MSEGLSTLPRLATLAVIGLLWSLASAMVMVVMASSGTGSFSDTAASGRLTLALVSALLYFALATAVRTRAADTAIIKALVAVGLAWSAFSAARQLGEHGAIPAHAIGSLVLFATMWRHGTQAAPVHPLRLRAAVPSLVVVLGLGAFLTIEVRAYSSQQLERFQPLQPEDMDLDRPESQDQYIRWYETQRSLSKIGNGSLSLVEYVDYTCGACRGLLRPTLDAVAQLNVGHPLKFSMRTFPLDSRCNELVPAGHSRPLSCEAAAVVLLAKAAGHERPAQEWLLGQSDITEQVLQQALDLFAPGEYASTLPSHFETVRAAASLDSEEVTVQSTPAFFLNGVRTPSPTLPLLFERVWRHELTLRGVAIGQIGASK